MPPPATNPQEVTPLLRAHQQQSFSNAASGRGESSYQGYDQYQTRNQFNRNGDLGKDPHSQFCALTGCPPHNAPPGFKYRLNERTLYGRAVSEAQAQNLVYQFTTTATNFLLLAQIVLGAALTGLGGTHVPGIVITLIGAVNTVIAGLITYLKSRGQPNRARSFRDDLYQVVDEIENSEVMWLGIAKGAHGYMDIDTDNEITVRSEVARLTLMLEEALIRSAQNNPESYNSGKLVEFGLGRKGLRSFDYNQLSSYATGAGQENTQSNQKTQTQNSTSNFPSRQAILDFGTSATKSTSQAATPPADKGNQDAGKKKEEDSPKGESSKQSEGKGKETSENPITSFARSFGDLTPFTSNTKKEETSTTGDGTTTRTTTTTTSGTEGNTTTTATPPKRESGGDDDDDFGSGFGLTDK